MARMTTIRVKTEPKQRSGKFAYAGIKASGELGFNQCLTIIEVEFADTAKEAVEKFKDSPRIKGDQKFCVMACEKLCDVDDKIGMLQVWMINALNDHDPYLCSTFNGHDIEKRTMNTYYFVEKKVGDYYRHNKNPKYLEEFERIKTADDFEDPEYVIQRACAPRMVKGVPVMQKRINIHQVLSEWFTAGVKKYAMRPLKDKVEVAKILAKDEQNRTEEENLLLRHHEKDKYARANLLMMYYKLFGDDNPLGIKVYPVEYFNVDTNETKIAFRVSYLNKDGHKIDFAAPERLVEQLYYHDKTEPIFVDRRPVVDDTPRTPEEVAESGKNTVAKFYAKYGSRAGKQPGEE